MRKAACFLNSIGKQQSRLIAGLQTQPGSAGQLQKAITYGEKALEMAEKSKDPDSLFRAIDTLVLTYRQVRNFDKARELIEKGFAVVKGLPPNTDPRAFWEGVLYMHLGNDLVRRREYEKAIDLLSLSVYLQQSYLATVGEILSG